MLYPCLDLRDRSGERDIKKERSLSLLDAYQTHLEVSIIESVVMGPLEEVRESIFPFKGCINIAWKANPVLYWFRVFVCHGRITLTVKPPVLVSYTEEEEGIRHTHSVPGQGEAQN